MHRWLIVLGLIGYGITGIRAQSIRLSVSPSTSSTHNFALLSSENPHPFPFSTSPSLGLQTLAFAMPVYVQENPRGFSPLCRVEILLEDHLPVAPWVRLSSPSREAGYFEGNANFVLKLKGF